MKNHSELFSTFQSFYNKIKNQFEVFTRTLHNDNGCEYLSHSLKHFMVSRDILYQTSCVNTPLQNKVVEHKSRHLV